MTGSVSIFLEPEFLALLTIIAATIGFAAVARRRRVPRALVAVAATDLFCGAVIVPLGTAHLVAVVGRARAPVTADILLMSLEHGTRMHEPLKAHI